MKYVNPAILALIALSIHCTAGDSAEKSADAPVKAGDVARDYKHLTRMTKEPVYVDPALAMLCRGASQRDVEEAAKKSGPHAHTAVVIYMNGSAAETFKKKSGAYLVGSIVVKEKKGLSYRADDGKQKWTQLHDGVGGMIKRPAGYDAEHGDWEYFYFEDPAKIESGKIASCVQCHAGTVKTDHVFGGWAAHDAEPAQ